jgi:hypothetical protein
MRPITYMIVSAIATGFGHVAQRNPHAVDFVSV